MELKIEKGIKPQNTKQDKGISVALRSLKEDESVLLPLDGNAARAIAVYALGKGGYICRKVEGGHRIWKK